MKATNEGHAERVDQVDRAALSELESAEDFLDHFGVAYDKERVGVCRLHILQRWHDYLARCADPEAPTFAEYRSHLAQAYADFVASDAHSEKVFRVLKRAAGITTIKLSAIGRARR